MKVKIIILFICVNVFTSFSQSVSINPEIKTKNEFSKNVVGVDAGLLYVGFLGVVNSSVNYERRIFSANVLSGYMRLGTGYFVVGASDTGYGGIQVPLSLNLITGKNNNHFELDLGCRAVFDIKNDGIDYYENEKVIPYPILNIGYRYQKPSSGFIFKSLIGLDGITLGIGYAF